MCANSHSESQTIASLTRIATADLGRLRAAAPVRKGVLAQQAAVTEQIHMLPSGDMLMSAGAAAAQDGTVVLHGAIGPFPYEIEITVKLEGDEVIVRLHVRKPIELGPYEWKFSLTGVVRDSNNLIVGASGLTPAGTPQALRLDWWCVLRCGGLAILGVLVECLPSLIGGPKAYIACVVGKLGASAAKIAECIAQKCA